MQPSYTQYESADGTVTMYLDEIDRERLEQVRPPAGEFLSVSVGDEHACAVRANHEVTCWGTDYGGETIAPKGAFRTVAAGWSSSCAIRVDQALVCWGKGPGARLPAGTFTSISAGQDIYCALRSDRTAACWGGGGVDSVFETPQPPSGELTDVFIVATARACGIRPDASVACSSYPDERAWMDKLAKLLGQVLAIGDECAIGVDRGLICFGEVDPDLDNAPETYLGTFTAVAGQCAIRTDGSLFCADFEPGVSLEPPATDMASRPPLGDPSSIYVLFGLYAALGAGAMLMRLRGPAGSGRSPRAG